MKKIFLFISIVLVGFKVFAQDGTTLHFMRLNPYSNYSSPSSFLPYNGYVGFPAISNINTSLANTGLHYDNVFQENAMGKVTTITLDKMLEKMPKRGGMLNTNLSMNVIDFGFRTKPIFFSFSYRIRMDEYLFFSKDVIGLVAQGNMAYVGADHPAKLDFSLNATVYQEFALGMQVAITPHVYIGVRPKILFGALNINTRKAATTLYTNPEDYSLRLQYDLDAYMSCVIPIQWGENGELGIATDDMMNVVKSAFKNVGAAIDFGATFRLGERWGVSASVLDLGFINWKTNSSHFVGTIDSTCIHYNDGGFVFNGLSNEDIQQIQDNPSEFRDEILSYFPMQNSELKQYTRMLHTRFLVEGYCNVGKYHRFSALFQGRVVGKQFLPSFTVAWNGNFLRIFDLCVNYTIAKDSYANLGLGVGFNLGVFHIYAATDNLLGFCNAKSIQRSLLNVNNANVQLGIVFDWGKIQEKKLNGVWGTKNDE